MTGHHIIFNGHIPSKKNKRQSFSLRGKSMNLPSKVYQRWHKEQSRLLAGLARIPSPVSIEYAFWIGGKITPKEFDLSNVEESINDLLVDLGIIEDDSWRHLVERHGYVAGFVRGETRCEVTLQHIPQVAWQEPIRLLKSAADIERIAKLRGCPKTHVVNALWDEIA